MRRLACQQFTARKTGYSIGQRDSFTLILTAICGLRMFKADLLRDEFHRIAIAQGFTPGIIKLRAAIRKNRTLPRSPIR